MSKPREGDLITIRAGTYDDDPWVDAEVHDVLSVQFTCHAEVPKLGGGWAERLLFAFFSDEGSTWKRLE